MKYFVLLICGVLFTSCSDDDAGGLSLSSDTYDFGLGIQEWDVDFVSYRIPKSYLDSTHNLSAEYVDLPPNLGNRKAIRISGTNVDGKLFMYMRKKLSGLEPNKDYTLAIGIELASSAQESLPEATNVLVMAGAFSEEPKKIASGEYYVLNVDISNVNGYGSGLTSLGNIGTSTSGNEHSDKYSLISFANNNTGGDAIPYHIRSNDLGEIWLIVGTESSFLGTTTVYYTKVGYALSASR